MLFPGGDGDYFAKAQLITRQVKGYNFRHPQYYPLFAIGKGFDYLVHIDTEEYPFVPVGV